LTYNYDPSVSTVPFAKRLYDKDKFVDPAQTASPEGVIQFKVNFTGDFEFSNNYFYGGWVGIKAHAGSSFNVNDTDKLEVTNKTLNGNDWTGVNPLDDQSLTQNLS